MEVVQFLQDVTPCLANLGAWSDFSQLWIGHVGFDWVGLNWAEPDWMVLAQQQFDTDVFATTRKILGDFVSSGRLWVLLIGIVIGYILKGLTSYG